MPGKWIETVSTENESRYVLHPCQSGGDLLYQWLGIYGSIILFIPLQLDYISVWCRMSWRCISFRYVFIKSRGIFLQWESHPELIPGKLKAENHSRAECNRLKKILIFWIQSEIALAEGVIPSGLCQGVSHVSFAGSMFLDQCVINVFDFVLQVVEGWQAGRI